MSRKWKPGDVALWDRHGAVEVIYHFLGGPDFDTPEWQTAHDGGGYPITGELRPLVVIDPEDREQVERLLNRFMQGPKGDYIGGNADDLQAALRSLIATPKPDEPTGLGAVVEDDGREWIHFGNGCWIKSVPNAALETRSWWEFSDAVREATP